eukprot:1827384-Rhodomonas_salina.4
MAGGSHKYLRVSAMKKESMRSRRCPGCPEFSLVTSAICTPPNPHTQPSCFRLQAPGLGRLAVQQLRVGEPSYRLGRSAMQQLVSVAVGFQSSGQGLGPRD